MTKFSYVELAIPFYVSPLAGGGSYTLTARAIEAWPGLFVYRGDGHDFDETTGSWQWFRLATSQWEIANRDGMRVLDTLPTRKQAIAVCTEIGPLADDWSSEGIRRLRSENRPRYHALADELERRRRR
jgi:hypothetical protein